MSQQLWLAILSSSLISAIIGALIAGAYTLRAKRHDYVNEYYKTVVRRRLAAYEQLEKLIVSLKTAVIDKDNRPYHLLFSKDDDWISAFKLLSDTMDNSLWLSDEAFEKTRDLNYRMFRLPSSGGVIQFGKENYEAFAELRSDLEKILASDMLELHNVEKFLQCKKKKEYGFQPVKLRD